MSWSGLTSLQGVTFANANDAVSTGVFGTRTSPGSTLKVMNKLEALTNYWVLPTNTYIANKTNNTIIVKRDLTPGPVLPYTLPFHYSYKGGHTTLGWGDPCSVSTTGSDTAYLDNTSPYIGQYLFSNTDYGLFLGIGTPSTTDWFSLGGTPVKVDRDGTGTFITAIGACISGSASLQLSSKSIKITLSSGAPCSDTFYMSGEYSYSGGGTYNWELYYSVVAGTTTQATQNPVATDGPNAGLTLQTGDVISKIYGGNPLQGYICGGNTLLTLINPIP